MSITVELTDTSTASHHKVYNKILISECFISTFSHVSAEKIPTTCQT